ncbi:MAG: SMP-30/Gluconolaconase/LRE-like region-containing protein [Planctomycetota bacterium]|nr:MAG: SMP-30/Gluconolaconase/LRE-like region-containing protein [Planctomycetota bacterium]
MAAKSCDGAALRAPYDIAVDPKGGFYFTDPGYVQIKNPIGKLHYVDRSGQVSVVVAKLGYPTGIVFDPARQRVLVAESHFNRIVEFRLSEPGQIESHEVLVQLPKSPDSEYHLANLCLDSEGNLYVTQPQTKTVQVFDPQGRLLGRFSTGTVAPSSVALRSLDATELFLTGDVEGRTRHGKVIRLNLGK